ncbi:acyltransferase family protein [Bifidobacterium merycicum]|nr:acyltransferase family protein [Bifidobacterium merycicum]
MATRSTSQRASRAADVRHTPEHVASGMPAASGGKRLVSVEVLRLLAIVCIAVFHAFLQQYVQAIWMGPQLSAADAANPVSALAASRGAMWIVAMIMYCGACGNHIFFMISGFFLIPRMCVACRSDGYWKRQLRSTGRRVAMILATVVFYLLLIMAAGRMLAWERNAGGQSNLIYELEFVWLYLVFVALAPVIAWVMGRVGIRASAVLAGIMLVAVYALNIYVACTWQAQYGHRSLLDWRKQMSAVSYIASFILAGLLGWALREVNDRSTSGRSVSGRSESRRPTARPLWAKRRFWTRGIVILIVAACAITGAMAMRPTYVALYALSFKSTSLISFALAVCALMAAACPPRHTHGRGVSARVESAVAALASGILGFYVVQTLARVLWEAVDARFLQPLLVGAAALPAGSMSAFLGLLRWIALGAVCSLAYVVVICLFDRFVRRPLLRAVHLSK